MGRLILALLAGHLYALASFEIGRLWAFSPFPFRPLEALSAVLACCFVLGLHQNCQERPYRLVPLFLAWAAVVGIPLNLPPLLSLLSLALLATLLVLACSPVRGAGLLIGLGLTLAGAGYHYQCQGWLAVGLALAACLEVFGPGMPAPTPWVDVAVQWKGFEQLVDQSEGEQGEEFRHKVLTDSHGVLVACGAVRLEQTRQGGVYRFEEHEALEVARFHLQEYGEKVSDVLTQAEHEPLLVSLEECR